MPRRQSAVGSNGLRLRCMVKVSGRARHPGTGWHGTAREDGKVLTYGHRSVGEGAVSHE